MKNLKRALAELEIIDSMEGFCVTEPYFIRGIVAGITVKVHSLTVKWRGEVECLLDPGDRRRMPCRSGSADPVPWGKAWDHSALKAR